MKIKPTHRHDCTQCQFITATHSDHGQTYDWYVCGVGRGELHMSVIGRYGSDGPQYWSMDVSTLNRASREAAYIVDEDRYAWSERMMIAFTVLEWWRTAPN